jgi:hypothetical protein
MNPIAYIPPLVVTKMIGTYHFEDGGYVAIVAAGDTPMSDIVDKARQLLLFKWEELEAIAARNAQAGEAGTAETRSGSVHEHAVPEGDAP